MPPNDTTRKLLGLSADATVEEIDAKIAELGARALEADELDAKLTAETSARKTASDALSAIRADRETEVAATLAADIARLDEGARKNGLWAPGDDRAKLFARLAASDIESARDYIGTLSPINPVGDKSQSSGTAPISGKEGSLDSALTSDYGLDELSAGVLKQQLRQMGVSDAQFAKHGPVARERREDMAGHDWLAEARGEA